MRDELLRQRTALILGSDRRPALLWRAGIPDVPSNVFHARVVAGGKEVLLVTKTGPHHDDMKHCALSISPKQKLTLIEGGLNRQDGRAASRVNFPPED